ncbi:ABC transporter ATP-binding protein [Nocardioides sp. L-11A]|uniref:ABC transporter ATP-binding protein n=1 Tax=Nocardioides sp. L-11A TaxID=3043848 RepID=UPI00249BFD3C|nr:ABC transporter ATP-binding protein [Nocardioides sp. L-11A]
MSLVTVNDLSIEFGRGGAAGGVRAVDAVELAIEPGRTYGLVGESGSGKSMTAMAILGLLPRSARVTGSVTFDGQEITGLRARALRELRRTRIGVVFQDPMTSLNPTMTLGSQVEEILRFDPGIGGRRERRDRAAGLLDEVGLADPARRLGEYPHEISGGMRQRVMIAMAIANRPSLLIADEPTTALDVTVQAQILELLQRLVADHGTTLLMITHDLGVAAGVCDEMMVMYGGRIVESNSAHGLFADPRHPYTQALLRAVPRIDGAEAVEPIAGSPVYAPDWRAGCAFAPRCARRDTACVGEVERLIAPRPVDGVRCVHPGPVPVPLEGALS